MSGKGPDWRLDAQRPSIPLLFWGALALWASCGMAFDALRLSSVDACRAVTWAAVLLGALSAAMAVSPRFRIAAFAACMLALGMMLASGKAGVMHGFDLEGATSVHDTVIVLDEDSRSTMRGEQATCTLTVGGGEQLAVTALFPDNTARMLGDRFVADVELSPIDYAKDSWSWGSGAIAQAKVRTCKIADGHGLQDALFALRRRAIEGIGGEDEAHAIMQALSCGYRRNVRETPSYAAFQSCGIAHLIAVSGAHLVIVTGLMAAGLRTVNAPRAVSSIMIMATMLAYLVLSGMPVSALRATAMSSLSVLSFVGKRRPSSLNALAVTVMFFVGLNPHESLSVSFALSALATAGIVLFAPLVEACLSSAIAGGTAFVGEALSLTFASSIMAQPFACSMFSLLPVVSPFANVVCAPLFPLACATSLAAGLSAGLGLPFASFAIHGAALPAYVLSLVAKALSGIPYSCLPFSIGTIPAVAFSLALACLLWLFWSTRATETIFAVCAALLVSAFLVPSALQPRDAVVLIDVGQGDSLLVRSGGQTLLIDTGNQDAKLKAYLADNRIAHLDSILITHADDDHCGSLDVVRSCTECERVLVAADMKGCADDSCTALMEESKAAAREVVGLNRGDRFRVGSCEFEVIWPQRFADNGGNADSLCVSMSYDGDGDGQSDVVALFTGDAEHDQLAQMERDGVIGDVDVLKVGHHGSRNGMTADDVALLKPEIALIGVGANNRYGHPTQEILDMLADVGCEVLRTDQDGTVVCELTPLGVHVRN